MRDPEARRITMSPPPADSTKLLLARSSSAPPPINIKRRMGVASASSPLPVNPPMRTPSPGAGQISRVSQQLSYSVEATPQPTKRATNRAGDVLSSGRDRCNRSSVCLWQCRKVNTSLLGTQTTHLIFSGNGVSVAAMCADSHQYRPPAGGEGGF